MKIGKRVLAVLMSMTMVAGLAACGSSQEGKKDGESEDEKIKITLMEWDSGVDNAKTEWEVFLDTFPEYKDKVEIEVVTGGSGPIDIMETMRKMVASGETDEMPDIITCMRKKGMRFLQGLLTL